MFYFIVATLVKEITVSFISFLFSWNRVLRWYKRLHSRYVRTRVPRTHVQIMAVCTSILLPSVAIKLAQYLLFKYLVSRNRFARAIYFLILNSSGRKTLKQTKARFTVRKMHNGA
jgi:hypothetical protein